MATTRKQLKKLETEIKTEQAKKPAKSPKVGVVMGVIPGKEPQAIVDVKKRSEPIPKPEKEIPGRFEPIDSLPGSPGFTSFGMKPRKKLHLQLK